jgi:Na+-transporting NADH:ubiquinone oxidoreductase subunit A
MPKTITIKKGLDIPLKGEAEKQHSEISANLFAIKPTDFIGITPKLLVKEGDDVYIGSPLFFSKSNEKIKFVSPVSGKITEIHRGDKRLIEEIRIESNGDFKMQSQAKPTINTREELIQCLLENGLWPMFKQRPYEIIANTDDVPKAIFISGFDSNALAPNYDYIIQDKIEYIQEAIIQLKNLTKGVVFLSLRAESSSLLTQLKGVELNFFKGPHPAGNIGTQIHYLNPVNKGEIVWHINLLDLIIVGKFLSTGLLEFAKTIVLAGSNVKKPQYYNVKFGQSIKNIVEGNLTDNHTRIISGNILTGTTIKSDGFIGFYDHQLTAIPEGDYYEFMGWIAPGLNKFSLSRTFISWLTPKRKYVLDTNLHGELRNFVVTGQYEKVFPWDILPVQLLKAIIIGDIELMENLGIYEVAEEDFALCEYVCTSKIESQQIVKQGIELIFKEMS